MAKPRRKPRPVIIPVWPGRRPTDPLGARLLALAIVAPPGGGPACCRVVGGLCDRHVARLVQAARAYVNTVPDIYRGTLDTHHTDSSECREGAQTLA